MFHHISRVNALKMLYLCGRYTWSPGWYCVLQISPLQSYFPGLQHPHAFHTILFERKSQFTNLRSSNFAPLPWGQNIHINYLKFLCMWGLFASFIHLVVMTHWYGLMYIYFKPWVIIRYFFVLLLKLAQLWHWGIFLVASVSLWCTHINTEFWGFCFVFVYWVLPYFLSLQDTSGSSWISPASVLELAILLRSPDALYWRGY